MVRRSASALVASSGFDPNEKPKLNDPLSFSPDEPSGGLLDFVIPTAFFRNLMLEFRHLAVCCLEGTHAKKRNLIEALSSDCQMPEGDVG